MPAASVAGAALRNENSTQHSLDINQKVYIDAAPVLGDGSGDALSKVCTELVHTADTTKVDGDVKEKLLCFALDFDTEFVLRTVTHDEAFTRAPLDFDTEFVLRIATRDEAFTRAPLDFDREFVLRTVTRDEAFTRAPLLTTKSFWLWLCRACHVGD